MAQFTAIRGDVDHNEVIELRDAELLAEHLFHSGDSGSDTLDYCWDWDTMGDSDSVFFDVGVDYGDGKWEFVFSSFREWFLDCDNNDTVNVADVVCICNKVKKSRRAGRD